MNDTYKVYTERGTLVARTLCARHAFNRRHDILRRQDGYAASRRTSKPCADCQEAKR